MGDVVALFQSDYFLTGLRFALVALLAGWLLWALLGRRPRPVPVVGILIAVALVVTLQMVDDALDPAIVPSLLMTTAGVGVALLLKAPRAVQAVAAIPGSLWLAIFSDVTELVWVRVMFAVLIPVAGYLITDFELRHDSLGLGVIYYALAVLGVFGAVPDTEWAVTLFAVTSVLTFLAWPKVAASLGPVGAFLAVTVLIWVTAHGGAPRNASIVGGVACLGLLLLEPIIIAVNPSAMRVSKFIRRNWVGAFVASIPQFMVVLICSRVAARFTNELPALVIVAFVYAAVLIVGLMSHSSDSDVTEDLPVG